MLTNAQNRFLTEIGPGTPAGELFRRYWHPIAVYADFKGDAKKLRVRVLGEDLILYKKVGGGYGLIDEQCAHRSASLYYGWLENDGCIRCPYHGWLYDSTGQCREQPFEQDNRRFKERVRLNAYPVREYRGIIFAYMGPEDPPPLLPKWDVLHRTDGSLTLLVEPELQCNWLQPTENSVDTVHTYYLHAHMFAQMGSDYGRYYYRRIEKFDFELNQWGIVKRRFYVDDETGEEEAEKGHPLVFPNLLRLPEGPREALQWRVPVDNYRTMIFRARFVPSDDGEFGSVDEGDLPPVEYMDGLQDESGEYTLTSFASQDRMAWETQGVIADRTKEHLGAEDKGIAMYRRLLREQIEKVERGEQPMGLIWDAEKQHVNFDTSEGQAGFHKKPV